MADSFLSFEQTLCEECTEEAIEEAERMPDGCLNQNVDPTVCLNCGKDAGKTELTTLAAMPTCDTCIALFRNRPFPNWIKALAVLLLGIVTLTLVWNYRFYMAYFEIQQSLRAFVKQDLKRIADLSYSAAKRVPENPELQDFANYFNGLFLLYDNQPSKALAMLNLCKDKLPESYEVKCLILRAQQDLSFDARRLLQKCFFG